MAPPRSRSSAHDPLVGYRRKRDLTRTPEPVGELPRQGGRGPSRFVVQRHRARRLHYDLRLEIGGVLVSWAVPKGPTMDPGARRAAYHVEDHPLEYLDFEGVIPAGEYGGGDVIVWDFGTWEPSAGEQPNAGEQSNLARAVAEGELHLDLRGQKLRGRFVLVRTATDASGKESWLLLHKRDEFAIVGWNPEDYPLSVLSGRSSDDVKADPDRMWQTGIPPERAAVWLKAVPYSGPSDEELRQLAELRPTGGVWRLFGRDVRVTNLDKVLFPARGREKPITKRELLRYSAQIGPTVLPYLTQRAINLNRYPNGAGTKGFWQKELPRHAPDWLPRWRNPRGDRGEPQVYLVIDEPAALVWAANLGALEWHAWTSQIDQPDQPTYALIDIDPGDRTSWDEVLVLARLHRTAFEHLGIVAQPKVTGLRGIQIWVPLARGPDFAATRDWVKRLSKAIGAVVPELVSWKWPINERGGLARLDYTQNVLNKTLVAPYSPRPARGAPVSAPIRWDELDDPSLRPDRFTVRTVLARVAEMGDLFQPVLHTPQQLPPLG